MNATWIPITQRLPEKFDDVLVTDGKQVATAYRVHEEFAGQPPRWNPACVGGYDYDFDLHDSITHWMPPPSPILDSKDTQTMNATTLRATLAKALGIPESDVVIYSPEKTIEEKVAALDEPRPDLAGFPTSGVAKSAVAEEPKRTSAWMTNQMVSLMNENLALREHVESKTHNTSWQDAKIDDLQVRNDRQAKTIAVQAKTMEIQHDTIAELNEQLKDTKARPTNDEYLRHELMDRTFIVQEQIDDLLADPFSSSHYKAWSQPDRAVISTKIGILLSAASDLYQYIGDKHLS